MVNCGNCDFGIAGTRYVCKSCACLSLCGQCIKQDKHRDRLKNYQEHTFVEIPSQFWHNAKHPVINCRGESLEDWIRRLTLQASKSSVKLVERGDCGPEHPDTLTSVSNLVSVLERQVAAIVSQGCKIH